MDEVDRLQILTNDNILLSQRRKVSVDSCNDLQNLNAINCKSPSAISCNYSVQLTALESVQKFIQASISSNTRKAYQSDLNHFTNWGGTIPSTPEAISSYLAEHAEKLSSATLNRRIVSLCKAHTSKGLLSPTRSELVKRTLKGIKRTYGVNQRQATPLLKNDLVNIVRGLFGHKGVRDKALLLIGFAGGFRRGELVSIQVSDLSFVKQGLIIRLRRSKSDQEMIGRDIAIPFARGDVCPVLALKNWLEVSRIDSGYVFRAINRHGFISDKELSPGAVALIVKGRGISIGLDKDKISGHSLRAGLVTSAAQAGISYHKIKLQTGHRSDAMVNKYIRDANIFIDNAAGIF